RFPLSTPSFTPTLPRVSPRLPLDAALPVAGAAELPPPGTAERFAHDYIASVSLAHKLVPGPAPALWELAPPARRIPSPGRPQELHVAVRAAKSPRPGALRDPKRRAQILHTFLHHELQA